MKRFPVYAIAISILIVVFFQIEGSAQKPKEIRGAEKCAADLKECDDKFQKNGCGSNDFDKELNQHKNRTTVPAAFKDVKYADMIRMKEPKKWDHHSDDRGTLETTLIDGTVVKEGEPIRVYGYLLKARREGAELCNCKLDADGEAGQLLTDIHMVITNKKGTPETRSFTAEITPRVRANAANAKNLIWSSIQNYEGEFVRVSGYLMLDTEHLHESPPVRVKSWEVHPVIKFEVCSVAAQNCSPTGTAGWRTIN